MTDPDELQQIAETVWINLECEKPLRPVHHKPRILRNFNVATRISFSQYVEKGLTMLEVNAGDMPGLLSRLGEAMDSLGIRVHNARINTLGEQAQDIFYVTTRSGERITDNSQQAFDSDNTRTSVKS